MKTIYYVVAAIAWLSLWSCTNLVQEVSPGKIPTATAKLVIHSFISPQDTVLAVYVQAPKAVLGSIVTDPNDFVMRSIPNATVDLSDGTQTVRLAAVSQIMNQALITQYYSIDARKLPIVAGRTYTLTVSAPSYSAASAQCTVPASVKPTDIQVDSLNQRANGLPGITYYGKLIWQDTAGQANFYQVRGTMFKSVIQPLYSAKPPQRDTVINSSIPLSFNGEALLSDQSRDGERLASTRSEAREYNYSSLERTLSVVFLMTLANVDENYYRYRTAIDQQEKAGENPFAEPVLIPSNIVGGLGCFGALNQSSLSVKVK